VTGETSFRTLREAAEYFRKPTANAMYVWCRKHHITFLGSPRKWLVDIREVERVMREAGKRAA
jgi:hypothetical protein